MNIFTVVASFIELFQKGKTVSWSEVANNSEAGAAALYGLFSALVALLNALGITTDVGGTDLHTIANGTTALASIAYGVYRTATNPQVGVK